MVTTCSGAGHLKGGGVLEEGDNSEERENIMLYT